MIELLFKTDAGTLEVSKGSKPRRLMIVVLELEIGKVIEHADW